MNKLLHALRHTGARADRQKLVDEACKAKSGGALSGVSFAGLDMSGLNLVNARLANIDFRESICHNVTFPPLSDCVLDGADAANSCFTRLYQCSFRLAKLNSCFFGARIFNCDFFGANMPNCRIGTNLENIHSNYGQNDFSEADMFGLDATGCYLSGTNFKNANLLTARLSRSNLSRCDFRSANLQSTNLFGAIFDDAIFDKSKLDECIIADDSAAATLLGDPSRDAALYVVRPVVLQDISAVASAIESLQSIRLTLRLRHSRRSLAEYILMIRRNDALRAMAFRASDDLPLRMYGPKSADESSTIIADITSDYVDWTANDDFLTIEDLPALPQHRPIDTLSALFSQLFSPENHLESRFGANRS